MQNVKDMTAIKLSIRPFSNNVFTENTELSTTAQLQAKIIQLEKELSTYREMHKKRSNIIRAFNASNTRKNSI